MRIEEIADLLCLLRESLLGLKMAEEGGWWGDDPTLRPLFLKGVTDQLVILDMCLIETSIPMPIDRKKLEGLVWGVDWDVLLSDGVSVLELRPNGEEVVMLVTTSGRVRVRWARINTARSQAKEFARI